jgi:hypothetical protein
VPSTAFASAHFASTHFLSRHFSGGTAQVIEIPYYDIGGHEARDARNDILLRVPNGHIIAIAMGALLIMDDDLG